LTEDIVDGARVIILIVLLLIHDPVDAVDQVLVQVFSASQVHRGKPLFIVHIELHWEAGLPAVKRSAELDFLDKRSIIRHCEYVGHHDFFGILVL
jgi:hypothetical protein